MILARAAERGDLAAVASLVEKPGIANVGLAIERAAKNGHALILECLLSYGDDYHRTSALIEAAEHGHADCVRMLLAHGVDATALNSSALQQALKHRHLECAAVLVPVSDLEAVVVAMLARYQETVDALAPHLSVELLRQAWRAAPVGMKLPRMQATLDAFDAAEALESGTVPASKPSSSPRL